jgi:CRISPR-associated endoribonuclease Cas6
MRFSVFYSLSQPKLPLEYRRGFLSLLKQTIELSTKPMLKHVFYSEHTLKPFTFSVYFPEIGKQEEKSEINVGKRAILNFSTFDLELAAHLYNGFLKTKTFKLFDNELTFEKIQMRQSNQIRSDKVVFKTLSPVLINNLGSSEWFLVPGEKGFSEGLEFSIHEMTREFLKTDNIAFHFKPLQFNRKPVWHYNMHRSSFTGVFEIQSTPELLQLIYDIGLGVRRGQGFGMLDVFSSR